MSEHHKTAVSDVRVGELIELGVERGHTYRATAGNLFVCGHVPGVKNNVEWMNRILV